MNRPTREQILAARKAAGLTQTGAGKLVHSTLRNWQNWEYGINRMHGGLWELFQIKTGRIKTGLWEERDLNFSIDPAALAYRAKK